MYTVFSPVYTVVYLIDCAVHRSGAAIDIPCQKLREIGLTVMVSHRNEETVGASVVCSGFGTWATFFPDLLGSSNRLTNLRN